MNISEIQNHLQALRPYCVEIFDYSVSHGRLTICATSEATGENLHIVCADCSRIAGPLSWNDGRLEFEDSDAARRVEIRDATAGFALVCGSLNARANVEPVYRKGQHGPPVDVELERRNGLLRKWDGASARIWEYTPTLSRLTVRVQVPERAGNFHAVCVGCFSIKSPIHWENCSLSIMKDTDGQSEFLVDPEGEVAICCSGVVILEDVEPVYFRTPAVEPSEE